MGAKEDHFRSALEHSHSPSFDKDVLSSVPKSRKERYALKSYLPLPGLKNEDLSPDVQTVMTGLVDEVNRLKAELLQAQARVYDLQSLADEDPLVPVLNRRGFLRELERSLDYRTRYKSDMCLLYIDLNGFKVINDTYGHAAGDCALCHVGAFLVNSVRKSDIVGRLGGDEFAVLLQHATYQEGVKKADALVEGIKKQPCRYKDIAVLVSLSVGITQINDYDTPQSVLSRADQSMYESRK